MAMNSRFLSSEYLNPLGVGQFSGARLSAASGAPATTLQVNKPQGGVQGMQPAQLPQQQGNAAGGLGMGGLLGMMGQGGTGEPAYGKGRTGAIEPGGAMLGEVPPELAGFNPYGNAAGVEEFKAGMNPGGLPDWLTGLFGFGG